MKELSDLELAKILINPKRNKILDLTKNEALTVKELAKKLNEKPSRLYYHVKKLEEYGLLEVAGEKQVGNLIEKSYRRNNDIDTNVMLNEKMMSESKSELMKELKNTVYTGLSLLEKELEENKQLNQYQHHVELSISYHHMTGEEWLHTHHHLFHQLGGNNRELPSKVKEALKEEDRFKRGKYVFVLLSYKIEDEE
ncbi:MULTISPECIES: winged helix-turn-helix domain-containing protein [Geobacillus]|jgi:DNA-binding transcriptional ArsR family regulator|uniref:ArsR family transcriptional regulator n=1 Tax=Bacillus caldolyticus TaxID=1394 RepID=A0ABM6QPH3_BACCL|nr:MULTISPECIES: helix-turn-helix domain-containing protein [Geobacillus]AKU26207.1 hypothetical protein IB49_06760 [Geobacillus sp. LC300]KZE97714.1 hypothetical protein AVP43_00319 [Geobacillus stearothermophilus]AUI37374.1 ArsR family transcriptional regulator [[Bacillus] caldolyticus]EQB94372.1 hypothetical protein GA8_17345 [Geobacillus sp. A8]KDE45962.1 hypothetical protein DI44_18300 [Geobacillus sp. CAMR5420]